MEYNAYNAGAQTFTSTSDYPMEAEADRAQTITDEFSYAITELRKVLSDLATRLQPVLRPLGPDAEQRGSDPMPPVSEIRDRLYSLHAASGEVSRLLDRLDV